MANWENQSVTEYLFEAFCQDKIEHDLQYMMMIDKENKRKQSESGIQSRYFLQKTSNVSNCETCPLFEGWKDPLGIQVLKCHLCDLLLQGVSSFELFNHVHHDNAPLTLTLILEDHE
jgi:hypothetical protein